MDKLESIREEDFGQCDSPKAKKVFINMLDSHMHSPLHSKQPKMKSIDGKSINLSSPCSYTSSSPSSTSSLSSISNVQHQKQAMAQQALNGSSEYISRKSLKIYESSLISFKYYSARYSQHAKFQPPSTNATARSGTSKLNSSITFKLEWRWWLRFSVNVDWTTSWTRTSSVSPNASASLS